VLGGVIGAIVFYALAAAGRDRISPTMTPSRYAYVGAAFMMPALALVLTGLRDLVRTHRSGASSKGALWVYRGKAIVVPGLVILVAAATAANVVAGVGFVRARTTYVRGLENQIITTAALLQNKAEMARAVNTYPIWASGLASGYLTPHVLAQLFRTGLLPRPDRSLMSPGEILNDQSWLDVTALPHPLSHGRFRLLGSVGVSWSTRAGDRDLGSGDARPGPGGLVLTGAARGAGGWPRSGGRMLDVDGGLGPAWPAGPSTCAVAAPVGADFPHHFRSSLRFGLMGGERSGSLWLSLGRAGGKVLASLSSPWGLEGLPGRVALRGQAIGVPAGGYTWVSDTAPGDDLVLQLPAGTDAELCRLAPASGPRPRRHFVLSVFARGPGKPLAFAH